MTTTATARENIGLYFQTGGGGSALTGTCSDNIIAPPHHSSNTNDTLCLGSGASALATCTGQGTYEELDATPDACGDISTADNNQVVSVEVDNALCQSAAGSNLVALPNCTSWQQPGGTLLCKSSTPNWPFDIGAIPGSPSKCNCDNTFTVPVVVQSPTIAVGKACNTTTTSSPNPPTFDYTTSPPTGSPATCVAGAEGGSVTYTVQVKNTSNFGSITLDQICDTAYGNIKTAANFTPACGNGTVANSPTSTDCAVPQTITATNTYTCTFTVSQGENLTVNDIASANGVGSDGTTGFTGSSSQVTVTSTDAPSVATITKSLNSIPQACATVRYNVNVHNSGTKDENLTLTGLTDDQLNIVPNTDASILATTCTQPQTLNVGAADYTCTFDKQFCDTPSTIITTAGTCDLVNHVCSAGKPNTTTCQANADCNLTCFGIHHTDTVNGTFTGDDASPADSVTVNQGTFTANVCLTTP